MKSKRFLAVLCLILCVVMVFSFAACGQDEEKPNDGDKVAEKVTVTFKNGDTVVDTIEIVKGTAVTATTKTVTAPEGKQFKSWQKDGADWDFTAKVNENITLTATFEDIPEPPVEKVTVTFKNGDTVVDTIEIVKGTAATATTKTVTAPEGKQFKSWQKDGADWDFTAKVNENITLIATFEDIPEPPVEKVTVTFKNGDTVVDTIEIVKGTAATATTKTVTAPEGKQFKSWQKDGADWDFTAAVNEDITLIATFEDIPQQKFTITFKDADGNVVDTIQVAKDDYISEDKVPTAPDLSAQHKTFVRWGLSDMPEIGIDYDMEIIEDVTYIAVYETSKYTVTIKDADTNEVLDTQEIPYGGKVTPFLAPIGKDIVSVKLGDADFDYEAYTVEGNIEILVKMAVATRTVKITGEGMDFTFTVPKGGTLSDADRAALLEKLATAPAENYLWSLDLSKLVGVEEDVTVTATKVPATDYRTTQGWLGLTTKTTDDEKATYVIVLGKADGTAKNPAYRNWGTLFWETGHYLEATMDIAGTLQLAYNTDKPGQHFTINVYIDGVLFKVETVDSKKGGNIEVANIPAGTHVIRMELASATYDAEGGEPLGEWAGFTVSGLRYYDHKPATVNVTFKNGDEVYETSTIPYGELVTKPETDPTPAEGYLFAFWSADGKTAYDFTKAPEGDLVLTAVYEKDAPSLTITFKDAEGTTIGTASVKEGDNAELPTAPSGKLWTVAAAEYAKLFHVTEAREVTLGTTDASNYAVQAGLSFANEANVTTLKEQYGADFETGEWGLTDSAGAYKAPQQKDGAFFTLTGDFSEFRFCIWVDPGNKCVYEIRVDDVLVASLEYDNTTGTKGLSERWVVPLNKNNMGAGQHTIKITVVGSGAVTDVRMGVNTATSAEG